MFLLGALFFCFCLGLFGVPCYDAWAQMLNLAHDWLRSFLPHVLTKIDRVSFGLLTPADLKRALEVRIRFGLEYDTIGIIVAIFILTAPSHLSRTAVRVEGAACLIMIAPRLYQCERGLLW